MFQLFALIPLIAAPAAAHLGFWHPSMYGFEDGNKWAGEAALPLINAPRSKWWFHGQLNDPPAEGQFFDLPAGGSARAEIACSKGYTSYGDSGRPADHPCGGTWGPVHVQHTNDRSDVKGSAIAIAYESDVNKLKLEDFVVISTNRNSPWDVSTSYQIPADLPACPPGGCHCMWGWVHSSYGGGDEIYFNGFRCQVTGATGTRALGKAQVPSKCSNGGCPKGPKQPLIWSQAEGNNIHNGANDPPYYNEEYGFTDGAQNDIFEGSTGTVSNSSPASSPSSGSGSNSSSGGSSSGSKDNSNSGNTNAESAGDNKNNGGNEWNNNNVDSGDNGSTKPESSGNEWDNGNNSDDNKNNEWNNDNNNNNDWKKNRWTKNKGHGGRKGKWNQYNKEGGNGKWNHKEVDNGSSDSWTEGANSGGDWNNLAAQPDSTPSSASEAAPAATTTAGATNGAASCERRRRRRHVARGHSSDFRRSRSIVHHE